jgi:hypothetical protein
VDGCSHEDRPAEAIAPVCETGVRAKVRLRNSGGRGSLSWKLGPQFVHSGFEDLGAPDLDAVYGLCIYDSTGFAPALVASYVLRPSAEFWSAKEFTSWSYRDRDGSSDGFTKAKLLVGPRGRLQVSAEGPNLALPGAVGPGYFNMDSYVEFNLVSSTGACWSVTFADLYTKRNTPEEFSASRNFGD